MTTATTADPQFVAKGPQAEPGMACYCFVEGGGEDAVIVSTTEHGAFVRLDKKPGPSESHGQIVGVPWDGIVGVVPQQFYDAPDEPSDTKLTTEPSETPTETPTNTPEGNADNAPKGTEDDDKATYTRGILSTIEGRICDVRDACDALVLLRPLTDTIDSLCGICEGGDDLIVSADDAMLIGQLAQRIDKGLVEQIDEARKAVRALGRIIRPDISEKSDGETEQVEKDSEKRAAVTTECERLLTQLSPVYLVSARNVLRDLADAPLSRLDRGEEWGKAGTDAAEPAEAGHERDQTNA